MIANFAAAAAASKHDEQKAHLVAAGLKSGNPQIGVRFILEQVGLAKKYAAAFEAAGYHLWDSFSLKADREIYRMLDRVSKRNSLDFPPSEKIAI